MANLRPRNRGRVHQCTRAKFNKLYKAAVGAAYSGSWYERAKAYGPTAMPRKFDRKNILIRAQRRAEAACGGAPLPGCPDTAVSIERVRLDKGGYESGGRYFGRGAPLFRISTDRGTSIPDHLRAPNLAAVKSRLRDQCPGIKFER